MKFERKRKEARARKKFEPTREKYEKCEEEEREKREEYELNEWREKCEAYKINELKKEFVYMNMVYGTRMEYRKIARMNRDNYEIYKAREYVANENYNGHECYNGVEGKKLWINRERWKNMHDNRK